VADRAGTADAAQGALRRRGHPHAVAPAGRFRRLDGGGPLTAEAPAGTSPAGAPERQATFREVFAVREFRPLFGTFLLSTAGDELARVALTVLVYQRTASPLLSALTFAIGHLPWLLGGPFLSTLADRLPRHRVLIATDAARAVVLAGMAIPGTPLPVLLGLLFLVSICAPPFESARSALMADVLDGDRYAVATSLTNITLQLAQVIGFLAAGALVAVLSPSAALLIDAATFAVSATWLWAGLKRRPAPAADDGSRSLWRDTGAGLQLIGRSPRLLAIMGVLWIGTLFAYASEGVAAPIVEELGMRSTATIGILLAANPLGVTVGGLVIARLVPPDRRERLVIPLVVLSLAPILGAGLVAVLAAPGTLPFAAVVGLLFVSGLGSSWLIPLNVSFVRAVPSAYRGRAFGVAVSGLYGVQALGALAAGLGAEGVSASGVLALSGGLGLIAVTPALVAYRRTQGSVAGAAVGEGRSES
jgi:MFS family permease